MSSQCLVNSLEYLFLFCTKCKAVSSIKKVSISTNVKILLYCNSPPFFKHFLYDSLQKLARKNTNKHTLY